MLISLHKSQPFQVIAMQEATNFLETCTSANWSKIVSMTAKSDCQLSKQQGKIHESTPKKLT